MASDQNYVDYVCEQIAAAGVISHRKMFGEYAVYCDEKVVALVCDNQFYVKVTAAAGKLLDRVTQASPFPGAKPWIVADEYLDDEDLITKLIRNTAATLPSPATKKPKKKSKTAAVKKVAKKK